MGRRPSRNNDTGEGGQYGLAGLTTWHDVVRMQRVTRKRKAIEEGICQGVLPYPAEILHKRTKPSTQIMIASGLPPAARNWHGRFISYYKVKVEGS